MRKSHLKSLGVLTPLYEEIKQRTDLFKKSNQESNLHPMVVFDCDKTLIQGDIGEVLFADLLRAGRIISDDHWWGLLSKDDQDTLRPRYEEEIKSGEWISSELFHLIWRAYEVLCATHIRGGYLFAAQCFTRWRPQDARAYCESLWRRAITAPLTQSQDEPISFGVRPRTQQKMLIKALYDLDVQVWIVSSSHQYMVEVVAQEMGILSDQVIGIDFICDVNERITSTPVEPVPVEIGKRDRFLAQLGHAPLCMIGDSKYDLPLMYESGFGALIDEGDQELKSKVQALGGVIISPTEFLDALK